MTSRPLRIISRRSRREADAGVAAIPAILDEAAGRLSITESQRLGGYAEETTGGAAKPRRMEDARDRE